ncbi:hypothetical protein HanPSC8_Chr13g0593951 [Helianthus annuus]|nr:hypothetical protein HanPSC8_Chr13g0593951 [Helianthus annuus]
MLNWLDDDESSSDNEKPTRWIKRGEKSEQRESKEKNATCVPVVCPKHQPEPLYKFITV